MLVYDGQVLLCHRVHERGLSHGHVLNLHITMRTLPKVTPTRRFPARAPRKMCFNGGKGLRENVQLTDIVCPNGLVRVTLDVGLAAAKPAAAVRMPARAPTPAHHHHDRSHVHHAPSSSL